MNFIRKKFNKVVLTVDIDRLNDVKKAATTIGFKENVDFFPIGKDELGKKCIEGLVPSVVYTSLTTKNPGLIQRVSFSVGQELKFAKNELKRELLNEFKLLPIDILTHADFYTLINKINKAFK